MLRNILPLIATSLVLAFVPRLSAEYSFVEGYNVLYVVTYGNPVSEFTNANFGRVTSAFASRSLQIGARIYF